MQNYNSSKILQSSVAYRTAVMRYALRVFPRTILYSGNAIEFNWRDKVNRQPLLYNLSEKRRQVVVVYAAKCYGLCTETKAVKMKVLCM